MGVVCSHFISLLNYFVKGGAILLNRRIASELSKILAGTWIPPFCKRSGICWSGKDGKTWHREVRILRYYKLN